MQWFTMSEADLSAESNGALEALSYEHLLAWLNHIMKAFNDSSNDTDLTD